MTTTLERDDPLPPHREREVLEVDTRLRTGQPARGWIARCACGFQTKAFLSEARARAELDDHILYLTRIGENEERR